MGMAFEFAKALRSFELFAVLVLCFGYSLSSSLAIQESDYSYNFDKHTTSSSPCFEQYFAESYFREHPSLVDSNFQVYVARRAQFRLDKQFSRLLDLERHLIGEGSHRRLCSSVRFSFQPDLISDFSSQLCEVIIIERLPSGIFADPFELEHLVQRGVFQDASVFGDTNLELPSFRSNRSIFEVHLDVGSSKSSGQEIVKEFKIEIPLHARYPPLEESGYSKVKFGIPELLMRCKKQGGTPSESCVLTSIASSSDVSPDDDDVVWSIPAGMKAHAGTVSVVTFTSALLSAILIIIASLQRASSESDVRLKQF